MRTPIQRPDNPLPESKYVPISLPSPTAQTGRPTKLTDLVANKILLALRSGSYRETACIWAGIPKDRFAQWMTMKGEPYETFQRLVQEAEGHAELRMVSEVMRQAGMDAKYAIAFLERKFPERWGRVVVQPASQTNVVLDLGSILEKIHARVAQFKDPREARKALTSGNGNPISVSAQRMLPHDPRPARSQDDRIISADVVDETDDEEGDSDAE